MKRTIFSALILTALAYPCHAADSPSTPVTPPPKGTVCWVANNFRNNDAVPISCKGLGKFSTVADIYERGYRVVTSGVLNEPGSTVYLIIELRN